jgi:hypothetical protein
MRFFFWLALVSTWLAHPALAQRETFGYTTFTPPKGWAKTPPQNGWMSYNREDKAKNAYCQFRIYEGFANTGDPKANFDHFWNQIVTQAYKLAVPAQTDTKTEDGWTVVAGGGQVTDQGYPYAAMLMVVTGHGVTVPYFFLYDNDMFVADIERFADGLDIKKLQTGGSSVAGGQPKPPVANQNNQPRPNNQTGGTTGQSGGQRITISTTNFDDGWVAKALPDYVQVTKDGTEVRIYAPDSQVDKKIPSGMYSLDYAWSVTVPPFFNTGQVLVRDKEQFSMADNMWEAPVTDKQSGKSQYAGLTIRWDNGRFHTILVLAPNRDTYYRMFPNFDSFARMLNYNKFAVAAADVAGGVWREGGSSSMDYYNIATGGYVGTSVAAGSSRFMFRPDGTYNCELQYYINGKGGKSNYKGKYTINQWEAVLTGQQSQDDNGQFWCSLEAVRGGFILHLVHKKYTGGQAYHLYRTPD